MCAICDGVERYTERAWKYGPWITLYIGKDGYDSCYILAQGDERTEPYYPKFCPECGRPVNGYGDD